MYSLSRWKASIFVLSDWERGSHMEDWVRSLFGLAGGLALFLYGMTTMSRALQQAAGERLRGFLRRVTRTPLTGALAGLAVSSILQSSSATTVMVIGFVSAGLMGLPQAVAVVFGANVGTTMTAQLVAFRLEDWVFPLLFVGVLVWSLARRGSASGCCSTASKSCPVPWLRWRSARCFCGGWPRCAGPRCWALRWAQG